MNMQEFNLETLLNDHQLYHSELQQDYFITKRAGGTLYGQYKQSLRELFKRFRGLKELYYNKEELVIDMEELEFQITNPTEDETEFDIRRKQLKFNKLKYDMIELNKNVEDTEREFARFYSQAHTLKGLITEKHGELTEETRNKLDRDMWEFKLKEMLYLDVKTSGRAGKNTIEFINALDKEGRSKLLPLASSQQSYLMLENWYENKDEVYEIKHVDINVPRLVSNNYKLLDTDNTIIEE